MEYNGYCVRIDAYDGYAEKIASLKMVTDYTAIVGIKHMGQKGDNPHYHLVIKTQVKDQAFRVRMRKVFNESKGNAHMGIKPWDGNIDAISYLFHEDENAPLLIQHNVSDETILKARQRNADVQVKMAEARERASWRLEDDVWEQIQKHDGGTSQDDIAKALILTSLRNGKYMPNDYLLKSMVARIQFRLCYGDVDRENQFADQVVWRVFHKHDN